MAATAPAKAPSSKSFPASPSRPTGEVELHGRVGSLLEVGTGFHPELTGRENIYLNGAILGMKRRGNRHAISTRSSPSPRSRSSSIRPSKRYSSGMYVRLAFAVAAHLEPEILIVDEVLAVGDSGVSEEMPRQNGRGRPAQGRTVLFVSHNMAAVKTLCSSAILMAEGKLAAKGVTETIIDDYLNDSKNVAPIPLGQRKDRRGSGLLRFDTVSFAHGGGAMTAGFQCGQEAKLRLSFKNLETSELRNLRVAALIENDFGQRLLLLDSRLLGRDIKRVFPGDGCITFSIKRLPLLPGGYTFTIWSTINDIVADWIHNAGRFLVEGGDYFGTGQLPKYGEGFFVTDHEVQYDRNECGE